jgi:hypothetical protein
MPDDSTPDTGPFRILPLDRSSERAVAALRLTAAVVVVGGAVWLALVAEDPKLWVCSGAAFVASLAWLAMGLRARGRIRDAARHRLVLDPQALTLVEGPLERRVPWADVRQIEVDEERLVVRVSIAGGEPVIIEPRFGGLGVHDLEAAVRRARDHAGDGATEVGAGRLQTAPT